MTNHEIWQAVLADFELTVSKANFKTWFKNTGISDFSSGQVMVCVPNTFTRSWLEKKYHSDLVKTIERITSRPVKKIIYTVGNIKNVAEKECSLTHDIESSLEKPIDRAKSSQFYQKITLSGGENEQFTPSSSAEIAQFGLNTKYTFDTFIVGKNNELAHAAAEAAARRPGDTYNPLFIYGGVGLGKTHLLQAVAHAILEQNPSTKILYVSSEKFTNEFVGAIKSGDTREFKDRYRTVDLLLIDDIQFIGGKEQTQEELFHTFNELHQKNKQIVFTSDRPPKAIPKLEDRLRSRMEWGMIADVSAPDLETRTAILESKCQEKNFPLSLDLLNAIATAIASNIRELEGALNKIIAFHELKNLSPTKESVQIILGSFENQSLKKKVTPRELIVTVAKFYDITIDDLLGKSREKRLSFPRQIIMYLFREDLKLSYPTIGHELGGRDHTTAMHAHTKISNQLQEDPKLKEEVEMIKQQLAAA